MMVLRDKQCILGVDPTPRGLAYVSFEDGGIQDWGTRIASDVAQAMRALDDLIDRCAVEVLVIEDVNARGCIRRARMRLLVRELQKHAEGRGVQVMVVSRDAVNAAWQARGALNKYAIAQAIGRNFYELEPLVPEPRNHYDIEPAGIHLFDAASLVLHSFGVEEAQAAP